MNSDSQNDFYKEMYNTKSYNLYSNHCTFVSIIYTIPWRETELFTRQIKIQIAKSTLFLFLSK